MQRRCSNYESRRLQSVSASVSLFVVSLTNRQAVSTLKWRNDKQEKDKNVKKKRNLKAQAITTSAARSVTDVIHCQLVTARDVIEIGLILRLCDSLQSFFSATKSHPHLNRIDYHKRRVKGRSNFLTFNFWISKFLNFNAVSYQRHNRQQKIFGRKCCWHSYVVY